MLFQSITVGQFAGRSKTRQCKSETGKVAWVSLLYLSDLEVIFWIAFSLCALKVSCQCCTPKVCLVAASWEGTCPKWFWAALLPFLSGPVGSKGSAVLESQIPTGRPSQRGAFQNQINVADLFFHKAHCSRGNALMYVMSDVTADKSCPRYPFFAWGNKQYTGNFENSLLGSHNISSHLGFNKVI